MLSTSEAERQKWHYNRKANAISLEPDDLVLAKANIYRGWRKVKDWWLEEPYEVEHQVAEGVPSHLMKNQQTGHLMSPSPKPTFPHCSYRGDSSLYDCVC